MPKLKFTLITDEQSSNLTLYHGGETYVATQTHPAWDKIYTGVLADDESVVDLFRPLVGIRKNLSERIAIDDWGHVFYDHDPVDPALTEQLVRVWGANGDVTPWVRLLENILSNPYKGSQEQIYRHLRKNQYTITFRGTVIAYKGVARTDDGYVSCHSGPAIVNGTEHASGPVPNNIGSVIEMPRAEVTYDPHISCAHGLHVASWSYMGNFYAAKLAVEVNPRDIVSVPHDYGDAKVRVCRYTILEEVTEPFEGVIWDKPEDFSAVEETPVEEEVQSTEKEPSVSTATRVRYPRPADWDFWVAKAKTRKQNLVKYITKMTDWSPIEGRDQTDRKGWAI